MSIRSSEAGVRLVVGAALLVGCCLSGVAEVKISNPGIPDRETAVYTETVGAESRPWVMTFAVSGSGQARRIEMRTVGADTESLYRLDPETLISLSSEVVTRGSDATVRRTADYRDLHPVPGKDDLIVSDLGSLPAVLRGFPWGRTRFARLLFVGNPSVGGGGVSFELQVTGREKVEVFGRSWDCWHAVTGLGGALGLVVPKTDWWFAVEGSHPLVKSSGPLGGPGTPTRTLALQDWHSGD